MDDVFDESANEMTVSANDYERENESIKKVSCEVVRTHSSLILIFNYLK